MADLGPGDRVGQYVLVREIGRGAMATVFEAEHTALGKRIALKRMHPHLAADATAAARFLREGKAATQIRSPHVVDVFDVATHDGVPFLVMELHDGVDLAALLRDRKKLPVAEIADLVVPVAVAMHEAHGAGVIHRDLKPSNILLARGEGGAVSPVILDFGISKLVADADRDLTASEVVLGTVHYMSPEQTRGGRTASARSDQYALGVLLYECVTGVKPFSGSTPYAVMHAIVSARVPPPSTLDPEVPAAFDALVLRAMSRDPRKRFDSVRALGAALLPWASPEMRRRYAASLGVDASAITTPKRRGRRWPAVALVGAAAAVVTVVAVRPRDRGPASAAPASSLDVPPPGSILAAVATPPVAPVPTAPLPEASDVVSTSPSAPATVSTPSASVGHRGSPRVGAGASASPSSSAPEHGTNGALIVE